MNFIKILALVFCFNFSALAINLEPGTWNCYYKEMGYVFTDKLNNPWPGFAHFTGTMSTEGCPTVLNVPYHQKDLSFKLVSDQDRNSYGRLICDYEEGAMCVFWGPDPQ